MLQISAISNIKNRKQTAKKFLKVTFLNCVNLVPCRSFNKSISVCSDCNINCRIIIDSGALILFVLRGKLEIIITIIPNYPKL